ncbi:MAG: hypothetical protein JWP44_2070 [Mucilaginibacter sp.]|nr:hypothetical protein [Mucilaginibacter sp.]
MENCNCHNEIILKGSGQLERYLKALDPSYVSIDGRSIEDLLVFATGYADQIRFYDMPDSTVADINNPKASWAGFFKRDMAVIAASIATVDLDQIKNDYDNIGNQILVNPNVDLYKALFNQIITLVNKIDQWYSVAIPGNPLHTDVNLAINSILNAQLKKAVAYEEGFIVVDSKTVLNIDYTKVLNQQEWGLNDPVDPEFDIYQGSTPEERILSAVPFVDDIFHAFYSAVSNIVNQSTSYINFALTQYPSHQPYMALFITFLKLFNLAQQQINGLTGRMLDFYYRDVLRLTEKPAVPDKVYVVFQLAQNVAQYDLPQGTPLSAGKDASGIDQVYKTEADFVINQATVKELKNIFIEKTPAAAAEPDKIITAIFANPVANSMDGNGKTFIVPNSKWLTFGNRAIRIPAPKNICEFIDQKEAELNAKNTAKIGFAIASPQLVLQGGNRLIQIKMGAFTNISALKSVQIALTGEKGWLTIDNQITDSKEIQNIEDITVSGTFNSAYNNTKSGFFFDLKSAALYIYLPVAEQGIIAFDAKLHIGHTYNTAYPVMQVLIGPDIEIAADPFHSLTMSDLSLLVQVGSINNAKDTRGRMYFDGLKTLFIKTDTGPVTPGKAFDPFTTLPYYGASFYIGSDEVFNKPFDDPSDQLTVNIKTALNFNDNLSLTEILDRQVNQNTYVINVLNNRSWIKLKQGSEGSFAYNILSQVDNAGNVVTIPVPRNPVDYHTDIDVNTDKGFLRIDSLNSFGDVQGRINSAPGLQIKEISVSYLSNLRMLDPAIDQFFHIYPFGAAQISIAVSDTASQQNPLLVNANKLLPQFTYLSATSKYQLDFTGNRKINLNPGSKVPKFFGGDNILDQLIADASGLNEQINGNNNQYSAQIQEEGMLFIGVANLQPLQNLSLLFQFADGSALNEDDAPPSINWSYLVYNAWQPLNPENIVSDSTYDFQTTGIVNISIPADANDKHTIITDGLYWLCASVTANSACIPQLINVVAQATEAQFYDQSNSPTHYDNALSATSISKLSVAVAQVSKVTQPFSSFDGKHKEVGKEYYTRVSERLRHKGRAITSWDYEHLVLDKFPNVFKVKCIANTDPGCLCRKPVTASENLGKAKCCGPVSATGNVLIVPVPNLKNNNAANPLQPKTNQLTLIEIVNYLKPLTSPFVKVYAKNPVYEQVIVFFRVKFLSGIDKGYYLKKLNDEIVQYLTPWAFDQTIEANFGQKIYASAIINFIQQRPYVDFITDFLMGVCRNECCPSKKPDAGTVTGTGLITALDQVSGCCDIEEFLQHQGYFIGEVIAEPSSPMSLLVSAPKHIILLYEEPAEPSPCEKTIKVNLSPTNPIKTPFAAVPESTSAITTDAVAAPQSAPVAKAVNPAPAAPGVAEAVNPVADKVKTTGSARKKTSTIKLSEDTKKEAVLTDKSVGTVNSVDDITNTEAVSGKVPETTQPASDIAKETEQADGGPAAPADNTANTTAETNNLADKGTDNPNVLTNKTVAPASHNMIEDAIGEFDEFLEEKRHKVAQTGKAAVKRAEDFFKNVTHSKADKPKENPETPDAATGQNIQPGV